MLTKNYLAIYAKSFNWAGFFLPKKTYENCSILYDFCRTIDDIVDNDEKEIDQKQKEISEHFDNQSSAFYTSGRLLDMGIIDPRETRKYIALWAERIQSQLRAKLVSR